MSDPPPPLPPKPKSLLSFFTGPSNSNPSAIPGPSSSLPNNDPPATSRPKRKSAAASDTLTQMQLGGFGSIQRASAEEDSDQNRSEGGPSTANVWKLAAPAVPTGSTSPIKPKAKRRKKGAGIAEDENAEVDSMSGSSKVVKKPNGKGSGSVALKRDRKRKGESAATISAVGAAQLDMIDPDLEEEDDDMKVIDKSPRKHSPSPSSVNRGRKRKSTTVTQPKSKEPSTSRSITTPPPSAPSSIVNGIIDFSNDSPSPRKKGKRKGKGDAGVKAGRGKGKSRMDMEMDIEMNGDGLETIENGRMVAQNGYDDDVEVLRENIAIDDTPTVPIPPKKTMWSNKPAHPFFGGIKVPTIPTTSLITTSLPPTASQTTTSTTTREETPELPELPAKSSPTKPLPLSNKRRKNTTSNHPDRAVHGFFSKPAANGSTDGSTLLMTTEKGTMMIDSDEEMPLMNSTVGKQGWGNLAGQPREVGWPSKEGNRVWSETRAQTMHVIGKGMIKRERSRQDGSVLDEHNNFWNRIRAQSESKTTNGHEQLSPLRLNTSSSTSFSDHPALLRIQDGLIPRFVSESWMDRYRPTESNECLGNERQAGYLVNWLKELEVGSAAGGVAGGDEIARTEMEGEKRSVIRRARLGERKRMAKETDWIVDDLNDPIGDFGDDDGMDASENPDTPATVSAEINPYPPFSSRLANSILLSGPTGSGKTAAVYAAASELGWEVFEVYPGIGKRSGEALRTLVGDVGKNHMVGKGGGVPSSPQPKKEKSNGITSFFGKQAGKSVNAIALDDEDEDATSIDLTRSSDRRESVIGFIELDGNGIEPASSPIIASSATAQGSKSKFRQSLILLEEVDVLYEEDRAFWMGVIGLIAESKRPVVMTCNDIATVPLFELPLQTHLQFSNPNEELTQAYLASIASYEDFSPKQGLSTYLRELFQSRTINPLAGFESIGDCPLGPGASLRLGEAGGVDMRGCLAQMQSDAGGGSVGGEAASISSVDTQPLGLVAERSSFADAFIAQRLPSVLDMNETDRYKVSDDDELPATNERLILKPRVNDSQPILSAYSKEEHFVAALSPRDKHLDNMAQTLLTARARYQRSTLPYLDALIPLESYLLPHPSIFLDLIPSLSWMVSIDDFLQQDDMEREARGETRVNRKTGRLMRIGGAGMMAYERQLVGLDEDEVEAVRRSRLGVQKESDDPV